MNKPDPKQTIKEVAKTVVAEKPEFRGVINASQHVVTQEFVQQHISRGPLPPPEMLKKYNEAVPNGADRIMSMAEIEQAHAHRMHKFSFALTFLGQVLGFTIVIGTIFGSYYCLLHDKPIGALGSVITALSVLFGGGYVSNLSKNPRRNKPAEPKPAEHQ